MAKIIGPALSIRATGTLGKVLAFVDRASGAIVRRRPSDSPTPSPSQIAKRDHHRAGTLAWQAMPTSEQQSWVAPAKKKRITPYTAFMGWWLRSPPPPQGTIWDAGATRWDAGATRWDITP